MCNKPIWRETITSVSFHFLIYGLWVYVPSSIPVDTASITILNPSTLQTLPPSTHRLVGSLSFCWKSAGNVHKAVYKVCLYSELWERGAAIIIIVEDSQNTAPCLVFLHPSWVQVKSLAIKTHTHNSAYAPHHSIFGCVCHRPQRFAFIINTNIDFYGLTAGAEVKVEWVCSPEEPEAASGKHIFPGENKRQQWIARGLLRMPLFSDSWFSLQVKYAFGRFLNDRIKKDLFALKQTKRKK